MVEEDFEALEVQEWKEIVQNPERWKSDGGKDSVRVVNNREEEEEEGRNRYKHKIICILEYGTWYYYTVR